MNDGGTQVSLGIIGLGRMAEAIVRGVIAADTLSPADILAARRNSGELNRQASELGIRTTVDNQRVAEECTVLLLAVKPNQLLGIANSLTKLKKDKLIISVAAGIPTTAIEEALVEEVPVVRAMPNTPALVGAGITAICGGRHATAEHLKLASQLLGATGTCLTVEEHWMDAITAISGSGPAYYFRFTEALAQAAISVGLQPELAQQLACETFIGAARLMEESGRTPEELRRQVTSPGGTTEAALGCFDDHDLAGLVEKAVARALARGIEIGQQATETE